ncbi:ferrochelatase-2, chloroplastic [Cynara cardunculus var. scolymus]|uniref:ferrochelatase-2, chloroplastic n=1 Tax=Cynara cardunculus var. scolymus TaxID=59895 RepID=UPI000D623009|nr:ferrochelatase-2, chloroplastic [Cynara cardunculus var. scolymus]
MKVKCWDFNGRYHEWSLHNYQLTLSPCIQFFPEKSKIHKIPYPNPQPNKRSLLLRLLPITTSQNILFCFLYTEMNHQSMNIRIQAPCPPSPSPSSAFSPRLHHKTPLILRRVICSSEVGSHVMLQTEGSSDVSNSSVTISKHKRTFGWSKKQSLLKQPLNKDSVPLRALLTSSTQDTSPSIVNDGKIGVLLLNLGGPETLDDVQPFLFNLFADPDIIRLPRLFRFLQKPLAQFISVARAPKSKEGYASIGGGSPLRQITDAQATELRKALYEKNVAAEVYVGMRYWHPFTEEAIKQIKKDGVNKLVVLPLYPQFSISTSGSSLRLLESIFREDEYLVNMQHTVIPSWYQREGYIKAMANLIEKELKSFDRPEKVMIFFSAHGVPLAYVEEAGDPYKAEMEECVDLIMEELERRKIDNPYTLAYQSRVGPVEWLKPYTDETIIELGEKGVKSLLAVPISFVSEHIETLEEIDVEYKELALKSGIEKWGRVPALGCEPTFILDLADAVIESLPYVGAMAVSNLEARQSLVPLGSVEELLATYDSQRRELPAPVTVWEWGWTKSAETWNGRAAMLAVLVLLFLEVSTGEGFLHQWGVLPLQLPMFP